MEYGSRAGHSHALALAAISLLIVVYAASLAAGLPQRGTAAVIGHGADADQGRRRGRRQPDRRTDSSNRLRAR